MRLDLPAETIKRRFNRGTGVSIEDLARIYGVEPTTMETILRELGEIPPGPSQFKTTRPYQHRRPQIPVNSTKADRIVVAYDNGRGRPVNVLARDFKVSQDAVYGILRGRGLIHD